MKKLIIITVMAAVWGPGSAQILINNFLQGYKEGDCLEKVVYNSKTDHIAQYCWFGNPSNKADVKQHSPVIGEELSYPGYNEKGPSIKFGNFPEEVIGSRVSVCPLDVGRKYVRGTYYLSFLVNFSKLGENGFIGFLGINAGYAGTSNRSYIYVGREGRNKIRFAVELMKQRSENPVPYDYDCTHLIILKMDYNQNQASLFVNPILGEKEPEPDAVVSGGKDVLKHAIRSISFRNHKGSWGSIGNFRLCDSWDGVIAH